MSIVAAELLWKPPLEISDAASNGGRMANQVAGITSAAKNNIFPDVPQAERSAGSTKWRKIFIQAANDAGLTLIAPKVFVETKTPGDDNVMFVAGTQINTQSQLTGTEQRYSMGTLYQTISANATSLQVDCEDGAGNITQFTTGMKVRISDRADIGASGNEEYRTLTSATRSGDRFTLGWSGGLTNGYSANVTKISGVYEPGDCKTTVVSWTESGAGTYNEATYPVVDSALSNIGVIYQVWTLTFTSATAFGVVGDTVGSVGTGNTSTLFAPVNGVHSKPYFQIRSAGWGGTWANNNTIVFTTAPAAIPIWYRRVVPIGAASLSGNSVIVAVDGESS